MSHSVAIAVLCIAVAGIAAQWLAWRLRLPAIVLLFAVGLIVGPGLQILQPAIAFGPGLRPIVGLAVAIVVFEGGLALDFRELRAAGGGVLRLTVVALPISFALATLAAHFAASMAWGVSALFGAITVVTGPTVVLPLLRNTRLQTRTASFFKWEAIVNDPIGALLAGVVLTLMATGRSDGGALVLELTVGLATSGLLGIGAAFLFRTLVNHDLAPETLKTPMLLALALGVYVLANLALEESGLAAATIFGIALANMHIRGMSELTRIKESLVVLIVSALFIVLTASLDRSLFTQLSWPILSLTAVMILVVRPLAILLSTFGSDLTVQERLLTGWIAPRGIVAAAVAGVASGKLMEAGIPGGALVMPAVFALIAATMILHGFSLAPLARRLGLTLGNRPALAIMGATAWSEALADMVQSAGTPVLLIDTYPGALASARAKGIPVLQAELLSEHGEESLNEHRIDYLLAATQNDVYNSLVCAKLGPHLGRGKIFQLAPVSGEADERASLDKEWRGHVIGSPPLDFVTLRRLHRQDGVAFALRIAPDRYEPSESVPGSTFLIIRSNGDLAFVSEELPAIEAGATDQFIQVNARH
jgi:NhaP-type Na+/H+ or K+/H+ antiporter